MFLHVFGALLLGDNCLVNLRQGKIFSVVLFFFVFV